MSDNTPQKDVEGNTFVVPVQGDLFDFEALPSTETVLVPLRGDDNTIYVQGRGDNT